MKKIKLVLLGNINVILNKYRLINWKSELFKLSGDDIQVKENLDNPSCSHGYYSQYMTDAEIKKIVNEPEELTIVIVNFYLEDNFYIRKIYPNCAVLSIKNPLLILNETKISIELFILKNIYEILTWSYEVTDLQSFNPGTLTHIETRRCLFDMNGDLSDISQNTVSPKLCESCISRLKSGTLPNKYIETIQKELKRIKRPFISTVEDKIKKNPLTSLLVTVLFTIVINIISNLAFNILVGA